MNKSDAGNYNIIEHSEIVHSRGCNILHTRIQYLRTLTGNWECDPYHFEEFTVKDAKDKVVFRINGETYHIICDIDRNKAYNWRVPILDVTCLPRPITVMGSFIVKIPEHIIYKHEFDNRAYAGPYTITVKGAYDEILRLETVVEKVPI